MEPFVAEAGLSADAVLERMERDEFVGVDVQVRHHQPTRTNVFEP